jgi:hypothetical protein
MSRILLLSLLLVTGMAMAAEAPETEDLAPAGEVPATTEEGAAPTADGSDEASGPETSDGAKLISGMSILGNQEAPKSLVIVPWKSSSIGHSVGIATMLDDSRQPVDREVFLRALTYYEIRSEARR